jgi:nicotinic acetylcholine receptor
MSVPAQRSVPTNLHLFDTIQQENMHHQHEPIITITFFIDLKRKTLFYTFNLIIPCVCLCFLVSLTFYLPSQSGEKVSLCISILLSLTFFVLLLYDLIPATSMVVPLIGKYILFTIVLVTFSIVCTVVILNVNSRSTRFNGYMPYWAKKVFLKILPKFLMMRTADFDFKLTHVSNLVKFFLTF